MKKFNVTGLCVAKKHYMVDITEKINQIVAMVEEGQYFTINRARQFGKTTTLYLLEKRLQSEYVVISISFEGLSEERFHSPQTFCQVFLKLIHKSLKTTSMDLSFHSTEIATMLNDYEADHKTGMNIAAIADEIYQYTSGYPFLVSRICKHIDEQLGRNFTIAGVQEAVKLLSKEHNTLFDDMFKNLENSKELYDLIYDILIVGRARSFSSGNPVINLGLIYGILKEENQYLTISNKIFEIVIITYFITKDESKDFSRNMTGVLSTDVMKDGRFDMELCLRKFAEHYNELFANSDIEFLERHGRLLFLSYLKPLINGQGFFHIESGFTDLRRMDVVVDFNRDQFILELKLWKGDAKHGEAYDQLTSYLESKNTDTGYLLTFDFRKNSNKMLKAEWVDVGGKRIFDVIV